MCLLFWREVNMKISAINPYLSYRKNAVNNFKSQKTTDSGINRLNYQGINDEMLVMKGNASKYFSVSENVSNQKVGSKFIIQSKLPEYKDLRLLITPESKIVSKDKNNPFSISIEKQKNEQPSFKGRLYGSIRMEDDGKVDYKMQDEYTRFWTEGMFDAVAEKHPTHPIADDYNFFIPSDGDGTRYKDITKLQGNVTKPASYIPAIINNRQMSLVQGVISNFAQTSKLDKMFDFVRVKPAQGSAFAFLEGLKSGQIGTDKPIVFSWGDNLSDINVSRLIHNHEINDSAFTLTVLPVEKEKTRSLSIIKPAETGHNIVEKFVEKPQDDDFIESCAVNINGKKKYLSAVSPYIIAPEVLNWIKDNYISNPEKFRSQDKGYDFSSMVIAPVLDALNNGEIKTGNHYQESFKMRYEEISDTETWSDLGSQKDFSEAMKDIHSGPYAYIGLPFDMRMSLYDNVDEDKNITFNQKSKQLFNDMKTSLNLDISNVIAYCKDDNLRYN